MKNSWNQEINVGSVVYRGARLGNGSEYKMGIVISVDGEKPRVEWKFKAYGRWINADGKRYHVPHMYECQSSKGFPSLDSLIVVDFDVNELQRQARFHKSISHDTEFRSMQDYYDALNSFPM